MEGPRASATAWRRKQRAQLCAAFADIGESGGSTDSYELEHSMSQLSLGAGLGRGPSDEAIQDSRSSSTDAPSAGVGFSLGPYPADETKDTDSQADSAVDSSPSRPTFALGAPTLDPPTLSELDDISYLQLAFIQAMIAFTSSGNTLRFIANPIPNTPYKRWTPESAELVNGGNAALDEKETRNLVFLEYQSWLAEAHYALKSMGTTLDAEAAECQGQLLAQISEELEALEDMKEMEWERQQFALAEATQHGSPLTVDTSMILPL